MGIYVPGTVILGGVVWPGAGTAHSQDIPPDFYPPYVNMGPPMPIPPLPLPLHTHHVSWPFCSISVSPPLLPI